MCLEYLDIHDIVASAWSSVYHANAITSLAQKLRNTRSALRIWNKSQFESVKRQKLDLLEVLNELDILLETRPLSSNEFSLKVSTLNKLDRIH